MTRTGAAARPPMDLDERAESFFDWIQSHTKQLAIGAAVVAAVALGGWLYVRTEASKEQRAYESLARATEAVQARNWALAQSDLERITKRYGGTTSGQQATLLLSEVLYETGKYQQGIDQLQKIQSGADADIAPKVEAQIAVGYEQLKKFDQAAEQYRRAAEKARFDAEKDLFLADAARAYTAAGNSKAAREIWSQLAEKENSPVAGEARVRLGELEATAARKS